jgi:hypothetical protein
MRNRVLLSYGERQVFFNLQHLSILAKNGNLERHYNALHSNKHFLRMLLMETLNKV